MNSRKVRHSCFLVCLSVLLGFSWSAPVVAGDAVGLRLAAGPPNWGGGVGPTNPAPSVPVKPLPAGSPLAAPKTSQPPIAVAQTIEPTWPQPFELGPGERTGFGFVAGNPGLIVVNVRWTGVPLTVSLAKPGGGTVDQQGNGSVTLQYNATADDVRKGVLWGVSLRPTQGALKPSVGSGITVIEKPLKIDTRGVAKGTVNVQHPPGDMKLAQAELKARADRLALQAKSQPVATANVNVLAQKQAALQKQQAVRQAALLEQVRSKIPVPAYQQTSQRIALGAKPGVVSSQSSAFKGESGFPLEQKTGVAVKVTDTSVQPRVSSAGTTAPKTIVSPDPVIRLIEHSLSTGQPGDPVLLVGSGFSTVPGEVHFIVANGKDVASPVTFWSDTQIMVTVPDVSGILAFDGQVYVQRGASRTNSLAFRFEPSVEYKTLVLKYEDEKNNFMEGTDPTALGVVQHDYTLNVLSIVYIGAPFAMIGGRGDDEFAPYGYNPYGSSHNKQLKNGWTTDSAYLSLPGIWGGKIHIDGSADAYISEFTLATDTPYLKVHWWADFGSAVWYSPYIVIKGPKGVAYQ
jgi:hypothetical protein